MRANVFQASILVITMTMDSLWYQRNAIWGAEAKLAQYHGSCIVMLCVNIAAASAMHSWPFNVKARSARAAYRYALRLHAGSGKGKTNN